MAENKMKQVAELLGVEMGVPFKVKGFNYNPCVIKELGLYDKDDCINAVILISLLTGDYEIEQPILDDVEKRYLEGVLRPFKDNIRIIIKSRFSYINCEHLLVSFKNGYDYPMPFPNFEKGTMYKGMELHKEYTLKELGLFQDE